MKTRRKTGKCVQNGLRRGYQRTSDSGWQCVYCCRGHADIKTENQRGSDETRQRVLSKGLPKWSQPCRFVSGRFCNIVCSITRKEPRAVRDCCLLMRLVLCFSIACFSGQNGKVPKYERMRVSYKSKPVHKHTCCLLSLTMASVDGAIPLGTLVSVGLGQPAK